MIINGNGNAGVQGNMEITIESFFSRILGRKAWNSCNDYITFLWKKSKKLLQHILFYTS
jgi:hypothetical protein